MGLFLVSALFIPFLVTIDNSKTERFNTPSDQGQRNLRKKIVVDPESSSVGECGDVELPDSFFTHISDIVYKNGSAISGNRASLDRVGDNDKLVLKPEQYQSGPNTRYKYNITFNFGVDLTFETKMPDYYDLYFFLDTDAPSGSGDSIIFDRLTCSYGNGVCWKPMLDTWSFDSPIQIHGLFMEATFSFRILETDLSENKTIAIDRMSVIIAHKGSFIHYCNPNIGYYETIIPSWAFPSGAQYYREDDWWMEWNDGKEVYTRGLPYYAGPWCWISTAGNDIILRIHNIIKILNINKISTGTTFVCENELGAQKTISYKIWDFSTNNWGTGEADRGFTDWANVGTCIYTIEERWDTITNLQNYYKIYSNGTFIFRYYTEMYGDELDAHLVYTDLYQEKANITIDFAGYNVLNQDYPTVKLIQEDLSGFGTTKLRANMTAHYQDNTIQPGKPYCRIYNSTWSSSGMPMVEGASGLYETTELQSPDLSKYEEGDYVMVLYTEDSSGYGTLNITKILINNEDPILNFEQPYEGEYFPMDLTNFGTDVFLKDTDNAQSYYDGKLFVQLQFKPTGATTDWYLLEYQGGIQWSIELKYDDLKDWYSGEYIVRVRAQDARGYYYNETKCELDGLRTYVPPATLSGNDNGSGGGESGSAKADSTVVMVAIIGCLGAGGAVAGIVVLKVRRGTSYRKDVKTIPKKFGKVGSFKTTGSSGVSKVSISTKPISNQTSVSGSNVFQINKSTDKKE